MRTVWLTVVLLSFTRIALAGSGVPTLRIGTVNGQPGEEVIVTIELDSGDAGTVLEVFNEITWSSLTPVRRLKNGLGQPDCFADILVVPNFASFTCTDESCTSLRAEVRSQGLPLADGPVYGCLFAISPDAPGGDYALAGSAAMYADADRNLHTAGIEDGLIRVSNPTPTATPTPAPVAVSAQTTNAGPGGTAQLRFDFADATGGAVDTGFDTVLEDSVFDLTMIGDDCALEDRLGEHRLTVLSLGDEDVPEGFTRIRFNVFDPLTFTTIGSGPLLSCAVPVRIDAPLGTSRIDLQRVFASDLDGLIPGVVGIDAFVVVTPEAETPTGTPTSTPTPTATSMPPPPCIGDCDGNGSVDIYEVVLGVRIALGEETLDSCPAIDADDDGRVAIDEIVSAVENLIDGCPATS